MRVVHQRMRKQRAPRAHKTENVLGIIFVFIRKHPQPGAPHGGAGGSALVNMYERLQHQEQTFAQAKGGFKLMNSIIYNSLKKFV